VIAEIIGPSGRVHYRRPVDDPLVEQARNTAGYSVRIVEVETVETPAEGDERDALSDEVEAFWDHELGKP
jgi:hypothetical protein